MSKNGYNWKARRQITTTVIDNTSTKKIHVDLDGDKKEKYDECNALVLPSKKRITKIKYAKQQTTKILSKKQRKHLEKIVEKKKKKENRASLLEALSNLQASKEELSQLTSIASVQTKGLKRHFQEKNIGSKLDNKPKLDESNQDITISDTVKSSTKRRKFLHSEGSKDYKTDDPNVVGFESSGSDVSDDENSVELNHGEEKLDDNEKVSVDTTLLENTNNVGCKETKVHSKDDEIELQEMQGKTSSENPAANSTPCRKMNTSKIEHKSNLNKIKNVKSNKKILINKDKKVTVERKPAVFIPLDRTIPMQNARLKLPILAEEQQIMETINENSVVILAGETGSGKTTQVPQFLYEAGYAVDKMIAVTEPRRVAAISMSKRVAEEMNLTSEKISYLIRFEGNATEQTKIKFMTDGVLLKEIQNDFLLTKYSVVILDEAHERSVYTDILIGLLSRIVLLRKKRGDALKLIIMSATLKLEDFAGNERLFKIKPPVIQVDARQYPVTIHFNKRTNENYLKEAYKKAVKIHTTLPDGGILIFVTGQMEVNQLVKRLRKTFPLKQKWKRFEKDDEDENSESQLEDDLGRALKAKVKKHKTLPNIDLDNYAMPGEEEQNEEMNSSDEDEEEDFIDNSHTNSPPLWTLPLYSLLPSHKQTKVFEDPPEGCRLCVVSTNVAETSLTIPHMKYVVDTGKTKVKLYDKVTGVCSYQVCWTSKASANQRAGRAGRVSAGHCYRLYSSAVFNDVFQGFAIPEIQQKPVDDLYLQMKCMNIDKVVNFPFPTAPNLLQLKTAERRLQILGALENGRVTPLGKAIAQFPVLPRFGKMLALSHQFNLLPYTVCMVASLSVQEVLLETPITVVNADQIKNVRLKWRDLRRQWAGVGHSLLLGDPMVLLKAVGAAEYANSEGKLIKFCDENGLRHKAVVEIRKLRVQLTNEININVPDCNLSVDPNLKPPTDLQARLLRQILLAGMGDQIAKRIHVDEIKQDEDKIKYKYAYRTMDMEDPVFLHSGSVLKKSLPEYVIYQEIYETNKMYMRGVTVVEPEWFPMYVPHLCNMSEPLSDPEPYYDSRTGRVRCSVNATFGRQAWQLPIVEIEFPKSINCYKWFAKFLLDGVVFKKLLKYKESLLSTPSTMMKSWAKLQPRTETLLKALMARDIRSKTSLDDVWKVQPQYLLHEYEKWLPASAVNDLALSWPPVDNKKI